MTKIHIFCEYAELRAAILREIEQATVFADEDGYISDYSADRLADQIVQLLEAKALPEGSKAVMPTGAVEQ